MASQSVLVISKGKLKEKQLKGHIALITGAGGGIGYETARSLIWLGAKIIIAENNKTKGKHAAAKLNQEFGEGSVHFVHTDIGNDRSVKKLVEKVYQQFGHIDILINNATITPIGAIHSVGIDQWDASYRVNLRGPVLLISHFLPNMLKRNSGIIVLVPSSGAAPYMGAYEVFKTSQVELSNTLTAELANTNIISYAIGPGIVKTDTANKAIEQVAPLYGKTVDEFYKMNEQALLTVEEAGAGFAASVALSKRYRGLEIGSTQALMDAGISTQDNKRDSPITLSPSQQEDLLTKLRKIKETLIEQVEGWKDRPLFERQWVIRDFKKYIGRSAELFIDQMTTFEKNIRSGHLEPGELIHLKLDKLAIYYSHQIDLSKGYVKDKEKLEAYLEVMNCWLEDIAQFNDAITVIKETT